MKEAAPFLFSGAFATMAHNTLSILIATTHSEELDAFHTQLAKFGCAVSIGRTNDDVAHLLQQHPWDVLIIDVEYQHEGGGFTLLESLKLNHPEHFTAKQTIFFYSNDGSVDNRLAAVRAGSHGFLSKPLDLSILLRLLDKYIPSLFEEEAKRILIIEDSDSQRQVLRILFEREGYQVLALESAKDVLNAVSEFNPDLILSDLYLGNCDGFELAQMLRQWERAFQIPIIILSGESRPDIRRTIVKAGIDDYLLKPMNFEDLLAIVRGNLERTKHYKQLIYQDSLTGLINHGHLFERLQNESKRALRNKAELSLVMIDLDDFKKVNDNYGHLAGDEVLRRLALLLKHKLRATDTAGRYGGEEIALILPDTPGDRAYFIVERLRRSFEEITFRQNTESFNVTFSFGVTCWREGLEMQTLWAEADESMYEAKHRGKNQGVIHASCEAHSKNHSKSS